MKRVKITFWGVRGSMAVAGRRTVRYGGNTSCMHVECDGAHLILDGGTGIHPLGNALMKRFGGRRFEACILLSHLHWDHFIGLPFFKPLHEMKHAFLIAGPGMGRMRFEGLLERAIAPPYFPIRLSEIRASLALMTVKGAGLRWGGMGIVPVPVSHPGGACGWRLFFPNGRSAVVMTDDEPVGAGRRRGLLRVIHGADLLIHDAQYTPESYSKKRGWGHSPFTYPILLAKEAKIPRVMLTHYDPDSSDRDLDGIGRKAAGVARAMRGVSCGLAREGLTLTL